MDKIRFVAACAAVACAFHAVAGGLPAEYQEVEWIGSSGMQYINTEVLPKANTRVVVDIAFTEDKLTGDERFGWGSSGNQEAFLFGADANGWYINISPDWKTACRPDRPFDNERHVFDVASGSQKFDGVEYGTSAIGSTASAGQYLWLFGSHVEWQASLTYPVKAKVYSCKIYEGATLVRDFVPCYETKENGAIGLYDTVGKKFYANAGSGTFSKGDDMGEDRLLVACDPAGCGSSTPEVGAHYDYAVGTDYTLTASANWTSADGCSRAVCVGCTVSAVDGDVVAFETFSGEGDVRSITYRHPESERGVQAVWQWAVENKVTVTADAGATVTEPTRWVANGGAVEFPISCDAAHAVAAVSGGVYRDGKIVVSNVTAPVEVTVTLGNAWYVKPDGDDEANDGHSFDTAFATIHKALAEAQPNDTICLSADTHTITNQLVVDKVISIVGAGREATRIVPDKRDFRAVKMSASATLRSFTVTGFTNQVEGSGIYMTKGTLDNVGVVRNKDDKYNLVSGVGIYMSGGTVTNSLIEGNMAESGYGGINGIGIYASGGTIVDSVIKDNFRNRTEHSGAGIFVDGAVNVIRCLITGNNSGGNVSGNTRGTGMYMNGNGTVDSCLFVSNGVHALYMKDGTVKNCLIFGHSANTASFTAGVEMSGGKIYNCTITDNSTKSTYSGMRISGGTAINNIIYGNGTLGGVNASDSCTFMTNVIDALSVVSTSKAAGNVAADPKFGNAAAGDFTLGFDSPAVDAAAPLAAVTVDILGNARGAKPDIGAYEYRPVAGQLNCAIIVAQPDWRAGTEPTVASRVAGAEGEVTYAWYVDGVLSEQTGPTPAFAGLANGRHTVKLVVTASNGAGEYTFADALDVHPTEVYVAEDGGDVYPYDEPAKAARVINDAFAAVWNGADVTSVVHVAEGTYPTTAALAISWPCRVLGAGRDKTIISGENTSVRGFEIKHADAVVKDLTVTKCKNTFGGTGIYMSSGWLENVRSTDNYQQYPGGSTAISGSAGLYLAGGTATNCLIDANSNGAGHDFTKGVGAYIAGGTLVDSVVCSNKMTRNQTQGVGVWMNDGKLIRCRVFENKSTDTGESQGFGVYVSGSALVDSCLIYSNSICGVHLTGGTVRNSVIFGHHGSGDHYAGASVSGGSFYGNTLYDNVATGDTAGRSGLEMSGGTAINNIIWNEGLSLGSVKIASGATFRTNITDKAVASGVGVIVADPLFADAENGDFRLTGASPAVDKGATLATFTVNADGEPIDIEGVTRPQKNAWDIGAYEYLPGTAKAVSIVASQTTYPMGGELVANAEPENIDPASATFVWTLTDAAGGIVGRRSGTGGEFAAFGYRAEEAGLFTLSLAVTADQTEVAALNTVVFTVKPTEVYVSAAGSDEMPYGDWEHAATNLTDAVNALWLAPGTTAVVHIAEGDYPLEDAVTMDTPMRVIGAGRDVTIVRGAKGKRGFRLANAAAYLADLTVAGCTNALTGSGAGVRMEQGTLANVRITKTYITGHGGAATASGLYMQGGCTVTNCLIDANASNAGYGTTAGMGVYMTGGLLVDSVVCSNWVNRGELQGIGVKMTGGTVRRCDIFRNTGYAAGNSYGMNLHAGDWNGAVVENSRIYDGRNGVCLGGNATIRNCLVFGHDYSLGTSAGLIASDSVKVYNCTIAGNTCTDETKGDATFSGGTVKNTIALTASVTGGTLANNCINEEVAFKKPAKGDYHLMAAAVNCIDQGDNSVWAGVADPKDLEGRPRIHKGAKGTVDLGCYEFSATGMQLIVR